VHFRGDKLSRTTKDQLSALSGHSSIDPLISIAREFSVLAA